MLWNDAVYPWNDAWGTILEDGQSPSKLFGPRPLWYDANTALVTSATRLGLRQIGEANAAELGVSLQSGDRALAVSGRRLLVARGRRAILIDLETGREGDARIDLGTDSAGSFASPLPSDAFLLSTAYATYRID